MPPLDDYSSNINTTGRLAVGAPATGAFESTGDSDWFKIHLDAGTTYLFAMTGADKGGGTLKGATSGLVAALYVQDASGSYAMGTSRNSPTTGNLPAVPFTPKVSGDYFVEASGWSLGTYTVTASIGPVDDYPDQQSGAVRVSVGGSITGQIGTVNDLDWFKATLQAGVLYQLSVTDTSGIVRLGDYLYASSGLEMYFGSVSGSITGSADTTGDYYARVTSSLGVASYTLKLSTLPDDYLSNSASTGRLGLGASVSGMIDAPNDADWFKIHLDAGQAYVFNTTGKVVLTVKGTAPSGYAINQQLQPDNVYISSYSGDYYLSAQGETAGGYTIAAALQPDDVGDAAAAPLGTLAPVSGRIDYFGDADAYKLAVVAGHSYKLTFAIDSPGAGTYGSASINFTNLPVGAGGLDYRVLGVGYGNSSWTQAQTIKTIVSGDLMLSVHGAYELRANYTVTAIDLGPDDFGDSKATAGTGIVGSTINARLDASFDIDIVKFALQAGTSYVFTAGGELASSIAIAVAPDTSYGYPYNARPTLYVTPAKSGDFYLSVNGTQQASGNYTLQAAVAKDDYSGNAATTGALAVGASQDGMLDSEADHDWFGISLEAGKTYDFKIVKGANTLAVYDAAGNKLVGSSAEFSLPGLQYTPTVAGRYFVDVGASDGVTSSPFSYSSAYTVSAAPGTPDDYPVPYTLALGTQVSGVLNSPADIDTFLVGLTKDHFYQFYLEYLPYAAVKYAPYGSWYALDRMDGNAVLEHVPVAHDYSYGRMLAPTVSGSYRLTLDSSMIGVYTYRLRVVDSGLVDDFPDIAPATANLSLGGQLNGALQLKGDVDAFTIALAAGQKVNFALYGAGSGAGTLTSSSNFSFSVQTAAGQLATTQSYTGEVKHVVLTAPAAGNYSVRIGSNNDEGSYVLRAVDVSGDKIAPTLAATQATSFAYNTPVTLSFSEAIMRGASSTSTISLKDDRGNLLASYYNNDTTHLVFSGNTITLMPTTALAAGKSYQLGFGSDMVSDWAGNVLAMPKGFTFSVAALATAAGPGNETYAGVHDGRRIDGGAGLDTVIYSGTASGHTVKGDGSGGFTVAATGLQTDTLVGIERIVFSGQADALALDVNGVGGTAYRIYQAAFNRAPDKTGIGYWMAAMEHGSTLRDVARGFIASAEFQTLYGAAPSDADFVAHLYQNVLHRAGEAAGVNYWMGVLDKGGARVDVLTSFSESTENQDAVVAIIGNGFAYTPYA